MRSLMIPCVLASFASCACAGPTFLHFEYIGNAELAGNVFTNVPITIQAKGLTTDIVTTETFQGTRHTMHIGIVIHIEGVQALDILTNMRAFALSDIGIVGFEEVGGIEYTFAGLSSELMGYALTSNTGPISLLAVAGTPPMIMPTALGFLSLGSAHSGTFSGFAHNPAPGSGVALAMGLALASRRRIRD